MATTDPGLKKRLVDLFNPITNPAGGAPANSPLSAFMAANRTPAPSPFMTPKVNLSAPPAGPMTPIPDADRARIAAYKAPAPVAPATPGVPAAGVGPVFAGSNSPAAPAPAPAASSVPRAWLKADGTIKTPEEIAADVGTTIKTSMAGPDVGKLALEQFGGNNKSAVELEADARRIGNTRNDIATGETDPYKVASQSGIAYTAQELAAIEKAYAGVYDPALDTALAKVNAKKDEDAAKLQAELDAKKPYTLGKNDVRYDGEGNIIGVGQGDAPAAGGGIYTPGADATVDAYVKGRRDGVYKPSDIPDEYKNVVAQGLALTQPQTSESALQAISVINELLGKGEDLKGVSGVPSLGYLFPGTDTQNVATLSKQLKGLLSLENRSQLKGSGAISDFEFRVLGEAASALGINDGGRSVLKDEDFKFQLEKLKLKLEVGETQLTDDELLYLNKEKGYSPEEIRQYNQQQSFNSVGNTTASTGKGNRPQRNNNPGNVKAGGLADSLAVGQDEQGHLIFPNADAGFKALTMDLTAKINGASRYLPANPTIAQLGKVYAEDPNWPVKVAAIIGVPTSAHTKAVPFDKLMKAVATQEGFYA